MGSSLHHAVIVEGAALYRDIRECRAQWREALNGNNGTSTGTAGRQPPGHSKRLSSPLHAYYPFLFHTLFQDVPIETVRELARADRFYTGHLLSYDRILDQGLSTDTTALFLAQLEHMQSLKRLYSFFPADHTFGITSTTVIPRRGRASAKRGYVTPIGSELFRWNGSAPSQGGRRRS